MAKRYSDVIKMTDDLIEDKDFVKSLEDEINSKSISKILFSLRCKASLTQKQIAEKTGFSQAKISKIENAKDIELNILDLIKYCNATGMQLEIGFSKQGLKLVDWVKYHFYKTITILDKMRTLCKDDEKITEGIEAFHKEAFYNFSKALLDCLKKVSEHKQSLKKIYVSKPIIDTDEDEFLTGEKEPELTEELKK
jgi:transcriptional regulator with XRE-family HTH domain